MRQEDNDSRDRKNNTEYNALKLSKNHEILSVNLSTCYGTFRY